MSRWPMDRCKVCTAIRDCVGARRWIQEQPPRPAMQTSANPAPPDLPKVPPVEPTYQVFMPPLRYDASAKIQDEPDPKLIVLVRRVRVRPTLIFQSRVEGDRLPPAPIPVKANVVSKPKDLREKSTAQTSVSVVDRVKTFFKSLWSPSS